MTNKLLNARLDAVQTVDNAVGLWTYIRSIWGTATGYTTVPDYGISGASDTRTVKFDTKFGAMKNFFNWVIVENMPQIIKPQILGAGRFRYQDVKRIQILCIGPNAKNNKWLIEKHLESLVNGNVTGMQTTYGIDTMILSQFQEIFVQPDPNITALMPTKIDQARSSALITLISDNYQASA